MRAVFIVGTGRSGTHFTVRLMNGFENAHDPASGQENEEILQDLAKAAIHHRLPSKGTEQYYHNFFQETQAVLLDQHHPNLYFVNHWSEIFDDIVFLYPQRPAYQIVASMMRHSGVMSWYEYARRPKQRTINRIPYPNRFLGLESFSELKTLPPHLLCAHRVIAHQREFMSSAAAANGRLRKIDYVALVQDPLAAFSSVFSEAEMARLGRYIPTEQPKQGPLTKYKDVLSDQEVEEIVGLEESLLQSSDAT